MRRFPVRWLLLTLASVLADPHLFLQDTVILAPAAVAVLTGIDDHRRDSVILALVLGCYLAAFVLYTLAAWHLNLFALYLILVTIAFALKDIAQGSPIRVK